MITVGFHFIYGVLSNSRAISVAVIYLLFFLNLVCTCLKQKPEDNNTIHCAGTTFTYYISNGRDKYEGYFEIRQLVGITNTLILLLQYTPILVVNYAY